MSITLSITSKKLAAEDINDFARDLCRTLGKETDVEARLAEGSDEMGAKGDPITVGTIILALITGGTVTSLINVLKVYFERSPSLKMDLKREDGAIFKIQAKNFSPEQIERTLEQAKEFFGRT